MTCNQLGGACDTSFQADSWEEMGELSKKHAMEMAEQGDQAHLEAMKKMGELMQNPEDMQTWMDEKKAEFEVIPEDV